jgi:hypothetical protein
LVALLEEDEKTAGTLMRRRVDGQHRDEVKLFILELSLLAVDIAKLWEKGAHPKAPVADLIKGQLMGPDAFRQLLDGLAELVRKQATS